MAFKKAELEQVAPNERLLDAALKILGAMDPNTNVGKAFLGTEKTRELIFNEATLIAENSNKDDPLREMVALNVAQALHTKIHSSPELHTTGKSGIEIKRIEALKDKECYSLCLLARCLFNKKVQKTIDYHRDTIQQEYHRYIDHEIDIALFDSLRSLAKNPEFKFGQVFNRHRKFCRSRIYRKGIHDIAIHGSSIDSPLFGAQDNRTLHDLLAEDAANDISEGYNSDIEDLRNILGTMIEQGKLTDRDIAIIDGMIAGKSETKIAEDIGISRQRVNQCVPALDKKLRNFVKDTNPGAFPNEEGKEAFFKEMERRNEGKKAFFEEMARRKASNSEGQER